MARMKRYIRLSLIGFGFALIILFPEDTAAAIRDGLTLCSQTLIPALFPYLILTGLFLKIGMPKHTGGSIQKLFTRIFGISGSGLGAVIVGSIGGYPTGAKAVGELYAERLITREDAHRLLFFACNAGPAFMIAVVGSALYHSPSLGLILLAIQILSSLVCGLILPARSVTEQAQPIPGQQSPEFSTAFVRAITDGVSTMLKICGFVCFFSLILALEKRLFSASEQAFAVLAGLTELSFGCTVTAQCSLPWVLKLCLTSAFISFGGLCVLCQTVSVLRDAGLTAKPYLLGKTLQALLSALFTWPAALLVSPVISTASLQAELQPVSPWPWTLLSLGLVFMIFLQFPSRNFQKNRL